MPQTLDRILGTAGARPVTVPRGLSIGLAVSAVVVAVLVTAYAAADSATPILWNDEIGYLSNAQILSGSGEPRDLSGRGYYYIGWSFLLVPLWWISSDPDTVYRLAVGLSAAASLATIVPLALLGKRLGINGWISIAAAAVIVMGPARTVQGSLALAESFLTLLLALVAYGAVRFAQSPSIFHAAFVLFFSTWAFVTHGRMVAVLGAVAVWVAITRRRSWLSTGLVLVASAALSLGSFVLYRSLAERLYGAESNRESVGLARIFGIDPLAGAIAGAGQIWYLHIAWLGLAIAGVVLLVRSAVGEVRERRLGGAGWALITLVGVFGVSVAWISTRIGEGTARLDMFTYGRYLDPITTVLAFLGLVWVLKGLTRRESVLVSSVQAGSVVLFGLFAVFAVERPLDLSWVPTSVAGLLAYSWPFVTAAAAPPWVLASVVGLVVAGGFLVLRARALILVVAIAIAFSAMSIVAEVRTMHPFFASWYSSFTLREVINELDPQSISFDTAGLADLNDTVSQNAYQFWLAPDALPVFDSTTDAPTTEYVIARKDWAGAAELGAELVAEDTGMFNNALWRLP